MSQVQVQVSVPRSQVLGLSSQSQFSRSMLAVLSSQISSLRYQIPGSRFPVQVIWEKYNNNLMVPGLRSPVSGLRCQIPSSRLQIPSLKSLGSGSFRIQVSFSKFQDSGLRCSQFSGPWSQILDLRSQGQVSMSKLQGLSSQVSDHRYQVSGPNNLGRNDYNLKVPGLRSQVIGSRFQIASLKSQGGGSPTIQVTGLKSQY